MGDSGVTITLGLVCAKHRFLSLLQLRERVVRRANGAQGYAVTLLIEQAPTTVFYVEHNTILRLGVSLDLGWEGAMKACGSPPQHLVMYAS